MADPIEQAEAILKAAEEATPGDWQSQHQNDLDGQLTIIGNVDGPDDGRFTFTNICDVDETPDECFANARLIILARNTAPAIALALIEKHKALEEAKAYMSRLLVICQRYGVANHVGIDMHSQELIDLRTYRNARAFLARQGEAG